MNTNPKLISNPLPKPERKKLLAITKQDIDAAIAKTKRSMNALIQAEVQ